MDLFIVSRIMCDAPWELNGIFSSREKAFSICKDEFDHVVKFTLDEDVTEVRNFEEERRPKPSAEENQMSKTELSGGKPMTPDHREINPATGLQRGYAVLTPEERARGFVRPVRYSYIHKACGMSTRMAQDIAETYARDPTFYTGTFCVGCRKHFPLSEFTWNGANDVLGS